jgi:hypothetical protein
VGRLVCCGRVRIQTARAFRALNAPGYTRAALNFRVEELAEPASRLTTETRNIYPGRSLIRYEWLEAIRRRAEDPGL